MFDMRLCDELGDEPAESEALIRGKFGDKTTLLPFFIFVLPSLNASSGAGENGSSSSGIGVFDSFFVEGCSIFVVMISGGLLVIP